MLCEMNGCSGKLNIIQQTMCKCNKCDKFYCTKHRLAEYHDCSFNYRVKTEEEIKRFIEKNKCVNRKIVI